ncbi:MAG: SAM hydrolase/SAM-dependent halogenase family protein [Flavobacteriaceae bacterium]
MPIVTLTTDFGDKDYFAAVAKAALLSESSDIQVIDISHQISPYNLTEAAYILKNAYAAFPKGSIHIVGVDSELTPENNHIALLLDGHYFIGSNNGILSMVHPEIKPDKIVAINIHERSYSSFPVLDNFVKVAGHLARKGTLEVIGKPIPEIKQLTNINPVVSPSGKQMVGSVIYIDNYGNVVTNITEKIFQQVGKTRPFTIAARSVKFKSIYQSYSDAINFDVSKEKREEEGKKLALFNDARHLELAIYKSNPQTVGGASSLFGLDYRDRVTVEFE